MPKVLNKILPKKEKKDRLSAIWQWKSNLEFDRLSSQLEQFKDAGFSEIGIRPARDMLPAYTSEQFFEILNALLDLAAKWGLTLRICENMAGGSDSLASRLTERRSALRMASLRFEESVNLRNARIYAKEMQEPADWVVLNTRVRNNEIDPNSTKNVAVKCEKGGFRWKAPLGEWQLFLFQKAHQYQPLSGFQLDYFDPKAISTYLAEIYGIFRSEIQPRHRGKAFGGFLFELPYLGFSGKSLYWSPALRQKYKARFRQDFIKAIPSLLTYGGKKTGIVRCQANAFLQKLFHDVALLPMQRADRKAGWKSEYYQWDVNPYEPDTSLRTIPLPEVSEKINGILSVQGREKQLESSFKLQLAKLNQSKRTTRVFLGRQSTSASTSIRQYKFALDRSVLCGARNWVLDGMAYVPTQPNHPVVPDNPFVDSPLWKHMPQWLTYARVFSRLVENSAPVARIAFVYPTASLIASYSPLQVAEYQKGIAALAECEALCRKLNLDFDVFEEAQLHGAVATNGKLTIRTGKSKGDFQAVLMPKTSLLAKRTLPFLKKAAAKSIPVLFAGGGPLGTTEDGIAPNVRKQVDEFRAKFPSSFFVLDDIASAGPILAKHCDPLIQIQVSHLSGENLKAVGYGGKHRLFPIFNLSETETTTVSVRVPGTSHLYIADCDKQELYRLPKGQGLAEGNPIVLDLQPRQMFMLLSSTRALAATKGHLMETLFGMERKYRIVFKNRWDFVPEQDNILPLTFWNMRVLASREGTGFSRVLETYLEIEDLPRDLKLVLPGILNQPADPGAPMYKPVEFAVNGIKMKEYQMPRSYGETAVNAENIAVHPLLGPGTFVVDVAKQIHKGFNRVSIRSQGNYFAPQSITFPPLIAGSFSLKRGNRGWVLCAPESTQEYASWTENGYPFYSGSGIYTQTFERPDSFKRLVIKFKEVADVAVMLMNGQHIATFPYEPMEIDVTHLALQGKNQIAIHVLNTTDNMVKLNARPSGLVGEVFLDVY